jgi:hypothetical protein
MTILSNHPSSASAAAVVCTSSDIISESYVTRRGDGSEGGGGIPMPRSKGQLIVDQQVSADSTNGIPTGSTATEEHLVRPK